MITLYIFFTNSYDSKSISLKYMYKDFHNVSDYSVILKYIKIFIK